MKRVIVTRFRSPHSGAELVERICKGLVVGDASGCPHVHGIESKETWASRFRYWWDKTWRKHYYSMSKDNRHRVIINTVHVIITITLTTIIGYLLTR